jgi:phospholipid-binding lipoprotein MlaA
LIRKPLEKRARMALNAPRLGLLAVLFALLAGTLGCATPPDPSDKEAYAEYEALNDPLEPLNRAVFQVNLAIDAMFLRPWADFYRLMLPPPFREGVHNILTNLRSPVILANDLLQGEFDRAGTTTGRFLINSTLGVGGLADWATDFGLPYHNEDFGQTLAVWGSPEGPFLMLPLLGPSNPRDAAGLAVDSTILDPFGALNTFGASSEWMVTMSYVRWGMTAIDARAQNVDELDDLQKSSLDYYAALRSLYRQFRNAEIYQGHPPPSSEGPSFEAFPEIPDAK